MNPMNRSSGAIHAVGAPPVPDAADARFLSGLTVLYVEDEAAAREQTALFLKRRVGRLALAEDGRAGLAAFEAERPDIVVTDVQMPELDGLSMVEEIRRRRPGVPVIVVTAFDDSALLMRSIAIGVHRYVTKPVQGALLDDALRFAARLVRAEHELREARRRELELAEARRDEALGILAAGLAHDFSNLVQTFVLAVDEVLEGAGQAGPDVEAERRARRHELSDAYREARVLAESLRLLSTRMETDFDERPVEPVLVAEVHRALHRSAVQPRFHLGDPLPPARYREAWLARVFYAIAKNAEEVAPPGSLLDVSASVALVGGEEARAARLAPGRYVRVMFRDQGPGIPPDALPRIFDPYFTTKPRGSMKGQGLSLALCRAIMRLHRGAVTASSPPGGGARFVVDLPLDG